MRHIKTYEGIFTKNKIPRSVIDGILSEFSTSKDYNIFESEVDKSNLSSKIDDRFSFIIEEKSTNGYPVTFRAQLVITSFADKRDLMFMKDKGFHHIKIDLYESGMRDSELFYDKWDEIDASDLRRRMNVIFFKHKDSIVKRAEREKFYQSLSIDEIKDLLADLYDIIGEFRIEVWKNKGKKGFTATFSSIPEDIGILTSKEGTMKCGFVPTDGYLNFIKEMGSLKKRLNDGYGLDTCFYANVVKSGNAEKALIEVDIFEIKKKVK